MSDEWVDVVVVNWNAGDCLRRCLNALRASGYSGMTTVTVVDNASTDDSAAMVRDEFFECRLVVNSTNYGFARANNQGVALGKAEFVLLLNPDAYVAPETVGALSQFLADQSSVGAVGPRLLNLDDSLQYSCRAFPTIGAGVFRQTPLGSLFPRNRFTADYLMSDWPHDEARNVDWLSGACLMLRRSALDQIGGLDERFHMYCEDVDLCLRLHQRGWRVCYLPTTRVVHAIGQSSNRAQGRMIVARHCAMLRYFRKHHTHGIKLLLTPLVVVGITARCLGALTRLSFNRARDRWRGRTS